MSSTHRCPYYSDDCQKCIDIPELTLDQELRFNILVPFYGAMEKKRQEDVGTLTWQDGSKIYTKAIKKIEAIISTAVREAEIALLQKIAQDNWQKPIPEKYILDKLAELKGEL